jgi:hypothetical protein
MPISAAMVAAIMSALGDYGEKLVGVALMNNQEANFIANAGGFANKLSFGLS